ncbi:MAG: TonB-dependent siderophore receptor [Hyphomonas sp.]|uniref:TonB-dependent receptor n=1 Tax=Hyphomonas sp. TaxID=87 RepID=UPI0034A03F7E
MIIRHRARPVAGRRRAVRLLGCVATLSLGFAGVFPAAAEDEADAPKRQETIYVYGASTGYTEDKSRGATKTDTPIVEIPQAMTVITGDLMRDQAMSGVGEALRFVPGVTVAQGEGHRDAPVLRGNTTTADFFVDGVRDDLQYYRDVYNTDRIEVLKGPSGLVFGRGTGGGVINRVSKQADGARTRAVTLGLGSFGYARASGDLGDELTNGVDARVNALYEQADSYREGVSGERYAIAPGAAFALGAKTSLRLSAEHFVDERVTDRGVPSINGRPYEASEKAFYGNPDLSPGDVTMSSVTAVLEHELTHALSLRTTLLYGDYDKFYQNIFAASAVNAAAGTVQLAAYNSLTTRENLIGQADLTLEGEFAGFRHTLLLGAEAGIQESENVRIEGQFPSAGGLERLTVSVADRGKNASAVFGRVSRDNLNDLNLLAVYAQNQVKLTEQLQVIAGVRFDRFDFEFDNRIGADAARTDEFISPRLGLVYEPLEDLAVYASWAKSYLPQSGEQFGNLTPALSDFDPEEFENTEIGVKWQPSNEVLLTAALFRLDRTNTPAPGPAAGVSVLTGAQRSEGLELSLQGELRDGWDVAAAYAWQSAGITETTSAAPAGRDVPLVPEQSVSIWNKVRTTDRLDLGFGLIWQDDRFATISNSVVLPSFTRLDAAAYYRLSDDLSVQINVENLTGELYAVSSHNDNNITLSAPLTAKVTLSARF